MSVFNYYSEYYDLLYKDKDYEGEVNYIHSLIQEYAPTTKSIVDFGCGTGNHDFLLDAKGYDITGVDLSQTMIDCANEKKNQEQNQKVNFIQGDFRDVRLNKTYDTALSLFHVMSYQTSNEDLEKAFLTAYEHLEVGGVFVFDFWYGPGVLSDPPSVRVKRLENERIAVTRISEPVLYPNDNKVDVCFEVQIRNKQQATEPIEILHEVHPMRYLFLPELLLLMKSTGFEYITLKQWMKSNEPKIDSWNAVIMCRKRQYH